MYYLEVLCKKCNQKFKDKYKDVEDMYNLKCPHCGCDEYKIVKADTKELE